MPGMSRIQNLGLHCVVLLLLAFQKPVASDDLSTGTVTTVAMMAPSNSCDEVSDSGGCSDRRCQKLVCDTLDEAVRRFGDESSSLINTCCDKPGVTGVWNGFCVKQAKALCRPTVKNRSFDDGDCPVGMACDYEQKANCTELALAYQETFRVGNILGGVYCGNEEPGRMGILNCPQGSYCPDPETILPCPAGYFCPHKTQEPMIICASCEEGSLQLEKELYGWIALIIIAVLVAVYIGWGLLNRYIKGIARHVAELEKRMHSKLSSQKTNRKQKLQQQQRDREKLQPKLEVINMRLARRESQKPNNVMTNTSNPDSDFKIELEQFDANRLFDVLDTDKSNDLTYDELNTILGLSKMELQEFIQRMNEMAQLRFTKTSVTRNVFAKYFMQVLLETSSLDITYEEAKAMFDELADGNESTNRIPFKKFYSSSMSEFMSDVQIFQLIRAFQSLNSGSATRFEQRESTRWSFSQSASQSMRTIHRELTYKKTATVERDFFVQNYPPLLMEIMLGQDNENGDGAINDSVDLCFKDLSLSVNVGKTSIDVVNKVTGRLQAKTMTALMGGSGAGKTSLLNALCGRAYYGETTGTVYINGHETDIQKHDGCIGFVPQDDIVYPELTVRENLIFAGKFRLPSGTSSDEIEELADETIANLGLSRISNSIVGDVKRRGVSGGEKKRVNIGLELMAMPSILFLDEPTSGLDATSALVVMKSLNNMVEKEGMTIVSVIHQPRKFIYDLFDSLILLGVGGKLVYHGRTEDAEPYFNTLGYKLPNGESVSDWLIDISSGRLEPNDTDSRRTKRKNEKIQESASESKPTVVTDQNAVGMKGVTTGKVVRANEDSKIRRAWLCREWLNHFENLDREKKSIYEPPEVYDLPVDAKKHSFFYQFIYQTKRAFLVSWRNRLSKIINCTIIVGSVVFITLLDGVTKASIDMDPEIPFSTLVRPSLEDVPTILNELFAYASRTGLMQYSMKVGLILCILIGMTATTTVTSKRLEFFREAGSGYDLNAYFCAINIILTLEHSIQAVLSAFFAIWIRHPLSSHSSFYVHFLLLAWLAVSWAILFPMVCSPDTVTLVSGFFFSFCGLILSGAFPPIEYKAIYDDGGVVKEVIAGWLSPTRFFFEAITVGEYRCFPEQSGFTIGTLENDRQSSSTMMVQLGYAGHDLNAVRMSCNGWYWSVIPAICVGLTVRYLAVGAMYACFRGQQAKKPLLYVMKRDCFLAVRVLLYVSGAVGLFCVTTWLFVRDKEFEENSESNCFLGA